MNIFLMVKSGGDVGNAHFGKISCTFVSGRANEVQRKYASEASVLFCCVGVCRLLPTTRVDIFLTVAAKAKQQRR